jgi:hypothetical protein
MICIHPLLGFPIRILRDQRVKGVEVKGVEVKGIEVKGVEVKGVEVKDVSFIERTSPRIFYSVKNKSSF